MELDKSFSLNVPLLALDVSGNVFSDSLGVLVDKIKPEENKET